MQEAAWPELVADFLAKTMIAHYHVMNRRHIDSLIAGSTALPYTGAEVGAIGALLGAVDLNAADIREREGMCDDDVLEVKLPRWAKALFRSDVALRPGETGAFTITPQELTAWFDNRNLSAQFVADFQTRGVGQVGAATPITAFPDALSFLMYPAGTWLKGNGPRIDLGVIRDSTLNSKNDYTAAWTEEATLIAKIGNTSRYVTVDVCPSGAVGAGTEVTC